MVWTSPKAWPSIDCDRWNSVSIVSVRIDDLIASAGQFSTIKAMVFSLEPPSFFSLNDLAFQNTLRNTRCRSIAVADCWRSANGLAAVASSVSSFFSLVSAAEPFDWCVRSRIFLLEWFWLLRVCVSERIHPTSGLSRPLNRNPIAWMAMDCLHSFYSRSAIVVSAVRRRVPIAIMHASPELQTSNPARPLWNRTIFRPAKTWNCKRKRKKMGFSVILSFVWRKV